jgi:hypothetical protein
MPKGILDLIAKLPPIDFAVLAERKRDACRWTKKGDKRPRADVEKAMAARAANVRRRQEEASARQWVAIEADRRPARERFIDARILCAMEPGHWYARVDIRDLSGVKYDSVKARVVLYMNRGWLERAENPDYVPVEYRKGVPVHIAARGRAPQYLYRLTPAGEAKRASVAFMA